LELFCSPVVKSILSDFFFPEPALAFRFLKAHAHPVFSPVRGTLRLGGKFLT